LANKEHNFSKSLKVFQNKELREQMNGRKKRRKERGKGGRLFQWSI
jgi:hypothetical protein